MTKPPPATTLYYGDDFDGPRKYIEGTVAP
jgi:hypothetical protein